MSAPDSHFVKVTSESLSRLTDLIEQVAGVLDQRGTLRVRTAIVRELHFALCVLRAANNSAIPGYDGERAGFLAAEIERAGALRGTAAERAAMTNHSPRLRIVGGTDMEART
jgi:hypothetical protein